MNLTRKLNLLTPDILSLPPTTSQQFPMHTPPSVQVVQHLVLPPYQQPSPATKLGDSQHKGPLHATTQQPGGILMHSSEAVPQESRTLQGQGQLAPQAAEQGGPERQYCTWLLVGHTAGGRLRTAAGVCTDALSEPNKQPFQPNCRCLCHRTGISTEHMPRPVCVCVHL